MYIKVENLGKKFGETWIFNKVNLMITPTNKVGVIGKNGAGKSTFLKVLAKQLTQDKGTIIVDPANVKIAYHEQTLNLEEFNQEIKSISNYSCFEYILSLRLEIFDLWKNINNSNESGSEEYLNYVAKYAELSGYEVESKIIKICNDLKLDPEAKLYTLSGGQKTRLQLSKILIDKCEILLLDEPTNHLDTEGLEWFYSFIKGFQGIVVIVSHDRSLLTHAVTRIIEFEEGQVEEYSGNYEFYLSQKNLKLQQVNSKFRENEKKVDRLNDSAKKLAERLELHDKRAEEVEQNKRMVRLVKKNKLAKTKIINKKLSIYRDNDKLSGNFKFDRQATKLSAARKNILTKARGLKEKKVKQGWDLKMEFKLAPLESDFILKVKDLYKSFDDKKILDGVSFNLRSNEKIAIKGPNGRGKTTLLKCIAGYINDYEGEILLAPQVKSAYLEQENSSLNYENTVLEEFLRSANNIYETEARSFLHFFLFEGDMSLRKVKSLSEGEKLKLKLAKLLYSESNLLLLDEPTNHLDIASQRVVEKALKEYTGAMIIVSHDNYLLNEIAIDQILNL